MGKPVQCSPLRQLPWIAPFAIQPFVGGIVVHEAPALGVPAQTAVMPVCQVAQMAHGYRSGADLDVADRRTARADAVQPITEMAGRLIEMHVFFTDGCLDDGLGLAAEEASIHVDRPVTASEQDAA